MRPIQIAPSVLPVDFAHFGDACVDLEKAGVDRIQFDVMDGRFVPNLTFGPDVIASVRPLLSVPFEAHLMVEEPDRLAHLYVEAGCQRLIVHAEACLHLHRVLGAIAELGATAAVALNPATPVAHVAHVLDLVDMVLVMTVNPGFGGQRYIASMEPKIAELARLIDERAARRGHRGRRRHLPGHRVRGGRRRRQRAGGRLGAVRRPGRARTHGDRAAAPPPPPPSRRPDLPDPASSSAGGPRFASSAPTYSRRRGRGQWTGDPVARVEAETTKRTPADRQRVQIRVVSMVAAVALTVTAAVVLTRPKPPARSTQAFCAQVASSSNLASVLASGDATQIRAAVHRFDQAARVAPPAIEGPAAAVVTYADGLAQGVAAASDPKAGLRAASARQQAQVAAVNAAGRQLDAFVTANCHLSLSPAGEHHRPRWGHPGQQLTAHCPAHASWSRPDGQDSRISPRLWMT